MCIRDRIETNEQGFCAKHFDLMLQVGKKLPVALILQSHLEKITQDLSKTKPEKQQKYLSSMEGKCYVCGRIERNMNNIYDNLFYLYQTDDKFRELFLKQKYFCLPHYKKLLEDGQRYLARKEFEKFRSEIWRIESEY